MTYEVGDLLKLESENSRGLCMVISVKQDICKVHWFHAEGKVGNTPGYVTWSFDSLTKEFVRLS
jgi:hypothetical protein